MNLQKWIKEGRPETEPKSDCVILNLKGRPMSRMGSWKIVQQHTAHLTGTFRRILLGTLLPLTASKQEWI